MFMWSYPKRRRWVALQLLVIVPFMFAGSVVFEMMTAVPGGSYLSETGQHIQCEALTTRGRVNIKPDCASFGSMETNPGGFALAMTAFVSLSALLWYSSRPRRGLRWHH